MEGLTIPKLFETHTSFPVNDLVLKTFDFAGLIESLGTGIKRMMTACKGNGNPPPEFRQEGAMFVATLKKKAFIRRKKTTHTTTLKTTLKNDVSGSQEAQTVAFFQDVLSGNSLRMALLILQNPSVKIEDISSELGFTRDGVNYLLRVLKRKVGLCRTGGRKIGGWQFKLPKRLLRNMTK